MSFVVLDSNRVTVKVDLRESIWGHDCYGMYHAITSSRSATLQEITTWFEERDTHLLSKDRVYRVFASRDCKTRKIRRKRRII